ncbi:MAG: hypothetical protein M1834_008190 [Cirrosporium novae-zelandiae]|nr:MAG: hypothetical protein M1834_008190 [Cirrosporium novae-zelandiae]
MAEPNPFHLAASNSPALLPLLYSNPHLASQQDAHGYSLLHAAASYNHLPLLRALVRDFGVNVNLLDEDGETALFVVETVGAARCLVEELGVDISVVNGEGVRAVQRIEEEGEGEWRAIVAFLREVEGSGAGAGAGSSDSGADIVAEGRNGSEREDGIHPPPPLPPNVSVNVGVMEQAPPEAEAGGVDEGFRRRIEELASREDFHGEEGQRALRSLVEDAVRGVGVGGESDREVKRRVE